MKQLYLFAFSILALLSGCSKNDQASQDFSFDFNQNGYLQETIYIVGQSNATSSVEWDFGDGSKETTEKSTSHVYTKPGIFTVTGKQGTVTKTRKIHIYNGTGSFQIKNSWLADFEFPVMYYIESGGSSPVGASVSLKTIAKGAITDTLFYIKNPKYSYDLPFRIGVDFKNTYGKSVGFTITAFSPTSNRHQVFEATNTTTGNWTIPRSTGGYQTGFGSLLYCWTATF